MGSQLRLLEMSSIGPIADHEQMKFIPPTSPQTLESAEQCCGVLLFRQSADVKQQGLTRINAKRAAYCFCSGPVGAEDFRVNTEAKHAYVVHAPFTQHAAQSI